MFHLGMLDMGIDGKGEARSLLCSLPGLYRRGVSHGGRGTAATASWQVLQHGSSSVSAYG